MPSAISYIRFSASHQGKGSTTERQQKMIDQWLSDHPEYVLSPLSAQDLGKSGYKGDHLKSGLGTIIAAIEAGQIKAGDVLLVEAMDRLGRLPSSEMHPLIWSIVKAGVSIVTLEDSMIYTEDSLNEDQSQLFILTGKVYAAYDYSARLSRRITEAYEKKRRLAREGKQIKAPRPYWIDSDNKLIPDAAEEMRRCVDLYLKGYGYRQIIIDLDLNENNDRTLKRRFQSRALIGEWENKAEGQPIAGVFEPLIDSTTFYRLQAEMKRRSLNPVPAGEYAISGLVKCGCCGASYHFRRREYKDYVIHYSNCSRYLKKASCTNGKTWPYEALLCVMQESKEYW